MIFTCHRRTLRSTALPASSLADKSWHFNASYRYLHLPNRSPASRTLIKQPQKSIEHDHFRSADAVHFHEGNQFIASPRSHFSRLCPLGFLLFIAMSRWSEPRGLSEPGGAAAHDLALADELGVEFGAVEGEEDVEVDA